MHHSRLSAADCLLSGPLVAAGKKDTKSKRSGSRFTLVFYNKLKEARQENYGTGHLRMEF